MSICNLNILLKGINFFDINEIQSRPLYTFCIECNIGEQDTSDCDKKFIYSLHSNPQKLIQSKYQSPFQIINKP